MKTIVIKDKGRVVVEKATLPEDPAPDFVLVKMIAMGINGGDRTFISGAFPPGFFPNSKYGIAGVSGVGKVIKTGEGVPDRYLGKYVAVYRSLRFSDQTIGTWSEYAHLHTLQCVLLPEDVTPADYSGSLVNIITPYSFFRQVQKEGHKGIINTAGNSATGRAMIGIGLAYDFPVLSIVQNTNGRDELEALGARYVLVRSDSNFKEQLKEAASRLSATAVFEGVGGAMINEIIDALLPGTTIYCYGFLGGGTPVSFHSSALMKGITLKSFSNFNTETVQDSQNLEDALYEISQFIQMPHFKTKVGSEFSFEEIEAALAYTSSNGGKAILRVS